MRESRYFCPCCGYRTISDTYEICEICGWEWDPTQSKFPSTTGANGVTLIEGRRNFAERGEKSDGKKDDLGLREPTAEDERDPAWRLLD